MNGLQRGFTTQEYENRLMRAQALMKDAGLDCLLLTTEPEVRYFTGFLTRFWESPTRPWFLVLPANAKPIAVIPSIGAHLMGKTWIDDIRTWSSPDLDDDGISLLAQTLNECVSGDGRIGLPTGPETHIRMPLDDYHKLEKNITPARLVSDVGIMRSLRMVKSEVEIAKISHACKIATGAFARVAEIAETDIPLDSVFQKFQIICLEEGADWVPYLAGAAQRNGYDNVISPATSKKLQVGDVLMLDTGLVHDGYFCDFNRNYSIGNPSQNVTTGHSRLMDAIAAGMDAARPGATSADLFFAMNKIIGENADQNSNAGRLGHGLGMQLTEWPSLSAHDHTVLQQGMVLTLEPYVNIGGGKIMVHEENLVIRDSGPQLLSQLATRKLMVL